MSYGGKTSMNTNELIVKYHDEENYTFAEIADILNSSQDLNKFQYSAYSEEKVRRIYMKESNTDSVGY